MRLDLEFDLALGCGDQGERRHKRGLCVQALQGLLEVASGLQPLHSDPGTPQRPTCLVAAHHGRTASGALQPVDQVSGGVLHPHGASGPATGRVSGH